MTLADDILGDIALVIDTDDFAQEVTVETASAFGKVTGTATVPAQLDSDEFARLSGQAGFALGTEGLVMYAESALLPERRKGGDLLRLDGVDYTVVSWEDRGGIARIVLRRAE